MNFKQPSCVSLNFVCFGNCLGKHCLFIMPRLILICCLLSIRILIMEPTSFSSLALLDGFNYPSKTYIIKFRLFVTELHKYFLMLHLCFLFFVIICSSFSFYFLCWFHMSDLFFVWSPMFVYHHYLHFFQAKAITWKIFGNLFAFWKIFVREYIESAT